jgi:A/G-specific adenine glycosylase
MVARIPTHALLRWYRRSRRPLPWRQTRDPYRIWVAEVMLQQTRVETVVPYYRRWLRLFPNVRALARAPRSRVMKAWEGLGYYARARHLHEAAAIVAREGWPDDLRRLPGVGPYIAAAVGSQALGRPEPVMDANIRRVMARFLGRAEPGRAAMRVLRACIPARAPGDFNQALMELGQTVCTPRAPSCPRCPLRRHCRGARLNSPESFPRRRRHRAVPHHDVAVGLVIRGGRILVARRHDRGLLGGLWEFPGGKIRRGERPEDAMAREVQEETGVVVDCATPLAVVPWRYSHFAVTIHAFTARWRAGRARPLGCAEVRWIRPAGLRRLAMPSANRQIIEAWERAAVSARVRPRASSNRKASRGGS